MRKEKSPFYFVTICSMKEFPASVVTMRTKKVSPSSVVPISTRTGESSFFSYNAYTEKGVQLLSLKCVQGKIKSGPCGYNAYMACTGKTASV